ncbi:MAG: hypothetical protein HYY18_01335 [Planctomycetes bacterium]|nr:hypothetical protein [Planctomycetota bacterium]
MGLRTAFLVLLTASPAAAGGLFDLDGKPIDEDTFRIEGRAWRSELHGSLEVDEGDFRGDEVDVEDDLDLDQDRLAGEGIVTLRLKRFRFEGRFWQQEFEGSDVVSQDFTYNGTTYRTFERVDSEVTLRAGGVDAEYILFDIGTAKKIGLEIGAGVGARYLFAEGAVTRDPGGPRERVDEDTVIPVVRASASLAFLNCLALEGDAEAMHIRYRDITTTYVEATVQAKLFLHHHVWLGVGYQYAGIELEDRGSDDDFDIELNVRGWFASLGFAF